MKHHLVIAGKTLSWRLVAAADTFLVAFLLTRSVSASTGIVGAEAVTKIVWFYAHEWIWQRRALQALMEVAS